MTAFTPDDLLAAVRLMEARSLNDDEKLEALYAEIRAEFDPMQVCDALLMLLVVLNASAVEALDGDPTEGLALIVRYQMANAHAFHREHNPKEYDHA